MLKDLVFVRVQHKFMLTNSQQFRNGRELPWPDKCGNSHSLLSKVRNKKWYVYYCYFCSTVSISVVLDSWCGGLCSGTSGKFIHRPNIFSGAVSCCICFSSLWVTCPCHLPLPCSGTRSVLSGPPLCLSAAWHAESKLSLPDRNKMSLEAGGLS